MVRDFLAGVPIACCTFGIRSVIGCLPCFPTFSPTSILVTWKLATRCSAEKRFSRLQLRRSVSVLSPKSQSRLPNVDSEFTRLVSVTGDAPTRRARKLGGGTACVHYGV